jgi:hypothetical protein
MQPIHEIMDCTTYNPILEFKTYIMLYSVVLVKFDLIYEGYIGIMLVNMVYLKEIKCHDAGKHKIVGDYIIFN